MSNTNAVICRAPVSVDSNFAIYAPKEVESSDRENLFYEEEIYAGVVFDEEADNELPTTPDTSKAVAVWEVPGSKDPASTFSCIQTGSKMKGKLTTTANSTDILSYVAPNGTVPSMSSDKSIGIEWATAIGGGCFCMQKTTSVAGICCVTGSKAAKFVLPGNETWVPTEFLTPPNMGATAGVSC